MNLRIKIVAKAVEELNPRNKHSDTRKRHKTYKSKTRRVREEKVGKQCTESTNT
jgi:hypothetical protein